MSKQLKYVCINCGNEVDDLYKQFGTVALKLTKCVMKVIFPGDINM